MKKLMTLALGALLISTATPLFAQDTPQAKQEQYVCELQAGNCVKRIDVIQRKMKKLQAEIKKGKKSYSAEDLQKLDQKLKEIEQMLDNMKAK